MFAELRDVVSLRVEAPRPVDISPECANMLERLCLAQAQELTFEKFRADGKNPGILARWAPRSHPHPCKLASFKAPSIKTLLRPGRHFSPSRLAVPGILSIALL